MRVRNHGAIRFTAPATPKGKPSGSKLYGVSVFDLRCPTCEAEPKSGCVTVTGVTGKPTGAHPARQRMARRKRNEIRDIL